MIGYFKILRFGVGFGVARALLFASPILLANLLSIQSYGQFELAHAYASIGALLLGCGLPGTVPLIRLRDEIEGRWDSLLGLIAALAGLCLIGGAVAASRLGTLDSVSVLVPLAIAVLMLQSLWATSLKCDGRSTSAVFIEAGFWAISVSAAGLIILAGGQLLNEMIVISLLAYATILITVTLIEFTKSWAGAIALSDLRQNLALGLPLMFASLLTVIMTSSGRLVLGQASGVEVVGLYAVLFRTTTLPLVGHQLLTIGFFRQIFSWSNELLPVRLSMIVLGVSSSVVVFWVLEPWFGWLFGERFVEVFAAYRIEGLILLVQTILWSAIALNDLLNSRLQVAGRVSMVTAPYLILGLGVLFLWTWARAQAVEPGGFLHGFVVGHFCLMVGFYALQCAVSWWLGHRFIRLWSTVTVCTVGTGLLIGISELSL